MKPSKSLRPKLLAVILLLFLGFIGHTNAAPGDVDLSFDAGFGLNGGVYAVAVQTDGKVVIGGDFTTVKGLLRRGIARLSADGSGDSTFVDRGPNEDINYVAAVVIQPDGKLLVGYESGLARLNPDGTPDPTFKMPRIRDGDLLSAGVGAIALQPDGKILIGGTFQIVDEKLRFCVARLNADGTLDHTFDAGGGGVSGDYPVVYDIALQPDGKLLIAGMFPGYQLTYRPNLARINPNGTIDETFDAHLANEGYVGRIAVQPDGKVLFGGAFLTVNGTSRRSIARVNADGSLDSSFDPGTGLDGGSVAAIALQRDGGVLICGAFETVNGTPRKGIARLNSDGSLDGSFEPAGGSRTERLVPTAFAIDSDGKLLVAAYDYFGRLSKDDAVIRLHTNGSRDGSFRAGGGIGPVGSIAVQPDGKIMIGPRVRLQPDGTLDRTFNLDREADGTFSAVTLLPNGKLLVGGGPSYTINGPSTGHGGIARVHADGSLDRSFDPGTGLDGGQSFVMAVQPDGKVLIGGNFETVNEVERKNVARLNADGSVDTTFNMNIGYGGGIISAVAVQTDGKILVGGPLNFLGDERLHALVRLNSDGSRDSIFNFPRVGTVSSIVIQPDGKIIVGGSFSIQQGERFPEQIARLHVDGSIDASFKPEKTYDLEIGQRGVFGPRSLVLQPDGKVLGISHNFRGTDAEGYALFHSMGIFRLNPDGSADTSFAVAILYGVLGLALQEDGKVLVGGGFLQVNKVLANGTFQEANGVVRPYLARLQGGGAPTPLVPEIAIEQPASTPIANGASTVGFGSIAPAGSVDRVFTVRNIGTAELSGVTLSIDGAQASFFTVTAAPADTVAAGGSTTFTVRFAPVNRGPHDATLRVTSNDEDESPFDIALSGSGSNASPIAFADSATSVSGIAIEIDVLANDSDPEGDALTITGASNPTNGTAQIVATSSGQRIRYTSAANYAGSDTFTYDISDGFGGSAAGTVTVQVSKAKGPRKISKGDIVALAGDPLSGVPAGATWKTFGVPSIASNGSVAFSGTIRTAKGIVPLVYVGSSEEEAIPPLDYSVGKKGDPAPGVAGATFSTFKDPLLNDDGTIVFLARLRGVSAGTNGGLWRHYPGQGAGASTLIAQLGAEPAGVPGARWKAFTSVALSDGAAGEESIAFTATMVAGTGGVRSANDLGLWIADSNGVTLALREGASVMLGATAKTVKSFVALQSSPGAAGQGNGATASGVLARVKFEDRTEAILRITVDGEGLEITTVALAGDPLAGTGGNLARFGLPAQSTDGRAAFIAALSDSPRRTDTAIIQTIGSDHQLVAREGDQPIPGDAAMISAFTVVVNDSSERVAFTAQLSGATVSGANNAALFMQTGSALQVIARKGDQPPGVPAGAEWAGFSSLALPKNAAGPLFVGTLLVPAAGKPNPAGITVRNSTGIWAVGSTGALRLIARTGDEFEGQRKVTALGLLTSVRYSASQARSFTDAGDIAYRVTLSDGSQQIIATPNRLSVPK